MIYGPKPNKTAIIATLILSAICFAAAFFLTFQNQIKRTTLEVKNASQTDTITVYLTLGGSDTSKWIANTNGIFGITTQGTQGSFTLAPQQHLSYTSPKGIQGNICFNSPPLNCPNETTVCEFCLNNYDRQVPNAQETTEISCVSGISFIANIKLTGNHWTANYPGYDTITTIQNGLKGTNNGRPGVYPFGCDDCTKATKEAPSCTKGKNEPPQKHAICNVQRNARLTGGTVTISYVRKVK